jgi:hypothetical protein
MPAPERSAELSALVADTPLDWDWLLEAAASHAVVPLLYRRLAAAGASLPPSVERALRARFDENALRNLALTHTLLDVLDRLEAAGVRGIPIKGPVLARMAYGDVALREFGDLDVVIGRHDLARAERALQGAGFRPAVALAPSAVEALMGSDYHRSLVNDATGVTLELHWALARGGGRLDDAWTWLHARRTLLLGREIHALSPEATLVYLCLHGSKHLWTRLSWIADVAQVVSAEPALDWDEVLGIAADGGVVRMTALGLKLAGEILGTEVPSGVRARINKDRIVRALAARVRDELFDRSDGSMGDIVAFQWRVRDNMRARVSYCAHLITTPHVADLEAFPLPSGLRGLYRVLRPLRLAARRVARVGGRA